MNTMCKKKNKEKNNHKVLMWTRDIEKVEEIINSTEDEEKLNKLQEKI